MITDIIELNNFIILIETSDSKEAEIEKCKLDDHIIGISFYASGSVSMDVIFGNETKTLPNKKGIATSFFGNKNVKFVHHISEDEPLISVSIFSTIKNIKKQPKQENELYLKYLNNLLNPTSDFMIGRTVNMSPEMQTAVLKIVNTNYEGSTRLIFLKSQITELLSHYFALISQNEKSALNETDAQKINFAKHIITKNMDKPPSINELSKKEMSVQEVSWYVGYESLSSFSNAFIKKYGFRPSEVSK